MDEYGRLVAEEITAILDTAAFEPLARDSFRIDVTDSFQRKLGECRPIEHSDGATDTARYEIRIARRLFENDHDEQWRDTVRHEVAHAYVFSGFGHDRPPHGEEWKAAARRAGADPSARYEDPALLDANYVLTCPTGCFEQGYLKRSKRIKNPWQYTCGKCDTRLVSYDADDTPSTLDPGTCYVMSLPWETRADREDTTTAEPGRYLLACPNGCVEWPYQQRSKRIKQPWRYTCPDCETALVSCDGQADPARVDPGTCGVASIPWTEPRVIHACPDGCFSVGFAHHSEKTRHPGRYRCGDCGAWTVAYPAGERPADLTPGTNYTE